MPRSSTAVGVNSVSELLDRKSVRGILYFSGHNRRVVDLVDRAKRRGITVRHAEPQELAALGATGSQQVVFVAESGSSVAVGLKDFLSRKHDPSSIALFLDGITDPHNIGAIFRVADQLGVAALGLPGRRSGGVGGAVAKTSAGAVFHVPTIALDSVAEAIRRAKEHGFWVFGADASGVPPEEAGFAGPAILVLGSEGRGMHRLVRERCDRLVAIPTWGRLDSLNVSVAAGILTYEMRKSLGPPKG